MNGQMPWYKSAILQSQIVAFVMAALSFFNITTDFDLKETVAAVFAGVGALAAVYAFIKRLTAPSPNLTLAADRKERELIAEGKLAPAQATHAVVVSMGKSETASAAAALKDRQSGSARIGLLSALALIAVGCTSTYAAYRSADTLEEQAYVLTEHYAALVHEAADLKDQPSTPDAVGDKLRDAANASQRYVLGDPSATPPVPSLRDLAKAYGAVHDATTRDALQQALDDAFVKVAAFLRALREAQGHPSAALPSRAAWADHLLAQQGGE